MELITWWEQIPLQSYQYVSYDNILGIFYVKEFGIDLSLKCPMDDIKDNEKDVCITLVPFEMRNDMIQNILNHLEHVQHLKNSIRIR